jgi:hypothetical protein
MRWLGFALLFSCTLPLASSQAQDAGTVAAPQAHALVPPAKGAAGAPNPPGPGAELGPTSPVAADSRAPGSGGAASDVPGSKAPDSYAPGSPELPPAAPMSATPTGGAATSPQPSNIGGVPAVADERLTQADAWVRFERERDVRTMRGERVFFPLSLVLQAGFGSALAVVTDDTSKRTRALFGASGGLAAAALLPAILSSSRDARRAWFGIGSAAFAVGLGASLISLENDHAKRENDPSHGAEKWIGAAVAVQGLAMLPVGLMPGFPDAKDYEAYALLPPEARPDAAGRLLLQIDRYEQRVTGALILSNLLAVTLLGVGAITNDDQQERQALGVVALAPLATALFMAVPRLFVASRNERFTLGEGPSRLGFNAW